MLLPLEPSESDLSAELADSDHLERGMSRLNEAQRTILVLKFYFGLTPS